MPETRTVTLRQLGLIESVTLNAPDTRREFFLPVPAGVPITDAALQFDGGYVRGDGGRMTMLVSLDGSPVLARAFTQDAGGVSVNLGVDGAARSTGFVRMGLGFASVVNQSGCARIRPRSATCCVSLRRRGSTYRYQSRRRQDLRTAWSALPTRR